MSLLYARTYQQAGGDYATDLIGAAGKSWTAEKWRLEGVASTGRPPKFVAFRGDTLIIGAYSRVLIRYQQNRQIYPAGIKPTNVKLAVAKGAGAGGDSGNALCFVTYLHKEHDGRILAESDRSNIVQLDGMAGEGYIWTIPATGADARVTRVRGWRSMDGGDYRLAWEVPYGTTTITENVLTANLLQVGPNQGANALPPAGVFYAVEFAGSVWYARTPDYPYRLWRSKIGSPECVHPMDYRDTDGRETITAIAKTPGSDELLVFTQRKSYIVRLTGNGGQTEYRMSGFDASVGCICEAGIQEIHQKLWVPGESGYAVYDGAFRNVMSDVRPLWADDYKANPLAYGMGFSVEDRQKKLLYFITPRVTPTIYEGHSCGTIAWVCHYEDFERALGGERSQPDWAIDVYGRRASSAIYTEAGDVVMGFCDGQIRKFDDTDGDDDGDALAKPCLIRHGHNFFLFPGDDEETGKAVRVLWMYVESEATAWTVYVLQGDEKAYRQILPDNVRYFWKAAVAASLRATVELRDGVTRTKQALPKTVHVFTPEGVSGRGMTLEIRMLSPVGFAYRGHGGNTVPGAVDRRTEFETNFDLTMMWRLHGGDPTWLALPVAVTLAEEVAPFTPVTVDLQTTVTYPFGPPSVPILLGLDFVGAHMPADVVGQAIGAGLVVETQHIFTEPTSGTVNASAVDHNNIVSNARDAEAVTVVAAPPAP